MVFFGIGTLEEWKAFDEILAVFSSASGMCISVEKSPFLYNEVEEEIQNGISIFMPYKMDLIMMGFNCLGYFLKPLGYGIKDWHWILKRFEKRISH